MGRSPSVLTLVLSSSIWSSFLLTKNRITNRA